MKKLLKIIGVVTVFTVSAYSQTTTRLSDIIDDNTFYRWDSNKKSKNTVGTPYVNDSFAPATIEGFNGNAMMRYDAYNDEFEFINPKGDTLTLTRSDSFNKIKFMVGGTSYQLSDYTDGGKAMKGYLMVLHEKNNAALYKKQRVTFIKEVVSTNSYGTNSPAQFQKGKDAYFWKSKEGVITAFPSGKRQLLKAFPDKKSELEAFIKNNDINFDKEADLIKLVDFLSSQ